MRGTVCIFDFDGTICDSLGAFVASLNQVAGVQGFPATSIAEVRAVPARVGLARIGVPLVKLPFLARKIRKEMSWRIHTLSAFPEMPRVLGELSESQTLFMVTSNSRTLVERFLRENRCHVFREIHSESDIFGKAQRLKRVLRQHRIQPEQAVYVGDETRDVEAARKIRMGSVAVSWGFSSRDLLETAKPDCIVDYPRDLPGCLRKLRSSER